MGSGEVSCGEGADDGEFTGEDEAGGDFGEGSGVVGASEVEELKAGVLVGEGCAASDGADHDAGEGDGGVEVAVCGFFESSDSDGGFGDAGDVLSGGEVEGGEAIGKVSVDAHGSAHDSAESGSEPVLA